MGDYTNIWIKMAFIACPLILESERRFSMLPVLPKEISAASLPSLSIIVPARNEETNLKELLPTLRGILYPGSVEIIVVDDGSTDRTALVAANSGAAVVQIEQVAEGWTGKSYACHIGAQRAAGDWLLFTDADTRHSPDSPARAVAYALDRNLDGLSIFLKHIPGGLLDGASLMAAFAGLFGGIRQNDAFLNGQYILVRRDVYEESGGFAIVSDDPLEDLALGHVLNTNGCKVPLLRSDDTAYVQMYTENRALFQGLSRISAGSLSRLGFRSLIPVMLIAAIMSPILAATNAIRTRQKRGSALFSWLMVSFSFLPWARRFGASQLALLAPIGALVVQLSAVWGLLRKLTGRGTIWKGRRV